MLYLHSTGVEEAEAEADTSAPVYDADDTLGGIRCSRCIAYIELIDFGMPFD